MSKALLKKESNDLLACAQMFVGSGRQKPQEQNNPRGGAQGPFEHARWLTFVKEAVLDTADDGAQPPQLHPLPQDPKSEESRLWALAYACQSAKLRTLTRGHNALVDAVVAREYAVDRINKAIALRKSQGNIQ